MHDAYLLPYILLLMMMMMMMIGDN